MGYKIRFLNKVASELNKIPDKDYSRIKSSVIALSSNPRPIGCKKLINEEGFRVRVGNYRILYVVDDSEKVVRIYKISHRKDAYK